jgi:hypothetical protein
MQTQFSDQKEQSLFGSGFRRVMHNKRYILWLWLLNFAFAGLGTAGLRESSHAILDHSLYAQTLTHGFHLATYIELLTRPEFGPMNALDFPAAYFAVAFFLATTLFLPGIFLGYSSNYRLPREDFFRACGRNLWRFIRLMIVAGIVMGIAAWILFGLTNVLVKKAGDSTNELLPFETRMVCLALIFLVMTTLRAWFDLAEADVVLDDQRAVRKSIAVSFRHTFRNLFRLLANYVAVTIVAAFILIGGLWAWNQFISPENVFGAFVLGQFILFFLLIPRFWQRGIAVSYWQQKMLAPVVVVPVVPAPIAPPIAVPDLSPAPAASEGLASN